MLRTFAFFILVLLGVAASAQQQTTLTKFFEMQRVPHVGGGDADVYSQNGRQTHVTVRTSNLSVDPDRKSVRLTIEYSVREGRSNHTHLRGTGQITLDADEGYVIVSAGSGTRHATVTRTFHGRDHGWNDVSREAQDTYLTNLSVKFDGPGDDNNGNARMNADVVVPVVLKREDPEAE